MKKLLVIITVALAMTVGFASTAGQAHATGGFSNSIYLCPPTAPYLHVNAFGNAYCSRYP